jgi:hypothetical protein
LQAQKDMSLGAAQRKALREDRSCLVLVASLLALCLVPILTFLRVHKSYLALLKLFRALFTSNPDLRSPTPKLSILCTPAAVHAISCALGQAGVSTHYPMLLTLQKVLAFEKFRDPAACGPVSEFAKANAIADGLCRKAGAAAKLASKRKRFTSRGKLEAKGCFLRTLFNKNVLVQERSCLCNAPVNGMQSWMSSLRSSQTFCLQTIRS